MSRRETDMGADAPVLRRSRHRSREVRPLIRHVVFFSVRDPADLDRAEAGLKLLETNPHALRVTIRRNLRRDGLSGEVDLVVYGEFADTAALDAYKAHPSYAQSIAVVRPLRDLRIAADFPAD
jgi:hypothetical protein